MQVSLTATGGLERRLEVAIPAAQVDGEVAQRLNKISRTARLKGFRPGKAPLAVIRQQYGEQVHGEVINDLMRASFSEAVAREKLNPAGGPRIEPIAMDPGADLKYAAVFEVLPEVKLAAAHRAHDRAPGRERRGRGSRRHARHAAQAAAGVQRSRPRGRRQRSRRPSTSSARSTARNSTAAAAQAVPIVIGANQVMKEFEDALLGAAAGDDARVQRDVLGRSHQQEARRQDRDFQREDREGGRAGAGAAR